MNKKAIILFSGGLDSTTCLALATFQGFSCYALSFLYGQKHHIEIQRAKALAKQYGVIEHKFFSLPLDDIGGSSLTDSSMIIPDHQAVKDIPNTYVPGRNTIFLAIAMAWGEVLAANDIFIGVNHLDYSGYPDCRPEYLQAFEELAKLATSAGVKDDFRFKIHAPLLHLNKAEIIQQGINLGIAYDQTISCYRIDDQGRACGRCDSCTYRKKGFADANISDPTIYC
jgi:7-cyano-7-deazaguanine synthase